MDASCGLFLGLPRKSWFSLKIWLIDCVCVCLSVCMYVYHMPAGTFGGQDIWSFCTGCKSPCGCQDLNLGLVLLTAEPLLQLRGLSLPGFQTVIKVCRFMWQSYTRWPLWLPLARKEGQPCWDPLLMLRWSRVVFPAFLCQECPCLNEGSK